MCDPGPAQTFGRLAGIVRMFGHTAGGRPAERLLSRLGMPVSDTTILRSVKVSAGDQLNQGLGPLFQGWQPPIQSANRLISVR